MLKKSIGVVLSFFIFLSIPSQILASSVDNTNDDIVTSESIILDKSEATLVDVIYFNPLGEKINISPYAETIPVGSIKIEDWISNEDRQISEYPSQNFTSFNTFKSSTIKIASMLPVLGRWVETGTEIWSFITDLATDLSRVTPSQIKIETAYTSRNFYHYIYRWNGVKWIDIGESLSKYYYKVISRTEYINGTWEFKQPVKNKVITKPDQISKAPNYQNKSRLSLLAEETYLTGGRYRERY